jgi:hypothetical protein
LYGGVEGKPEPLLIHAMKYWPSKRYPEIDIGRNSVSPCTTPKKTASRISSTPSMLPLY